MSYKGKPVDARQVAKDLNVDYVLAGSIQHIADRLRVSAQLIDAREAAAQAVGVLCLGFHRPTAGPARGQAATSGRADLWRRSGVEADSPRRQIA